ncbi:hypothetical protein ACJX0J_038923, partial [Zea mays]
LFDMDHKLFLVSFMVEMDEKGRTSSATAAHCYPWMDMCVYLENGGMGRPVDRARSP